jgi:hypothetical protein
MESLNRNSIRKLIVNLLKESQAPVSVHSGNVKIGQHMYKISADAGFMGTYEVEIAECTPKKDGSWFVRGDTSVKSVSQQMTKEKVDEVMKNLGKDSFTVKGKIADFIFQKIN